MLGFIKRLVCRHELEFSRNIHGDEINLSGGKRSVWYCTKCDAVVLKSELWAHPAPSQLKAFAPAKNCVHPSWSVDEAGKCTTCGQPDEQATPEPVRPLFAASVAARTWAELQAQGHRMQALQFDGGPGGAGSIDPWGKVTWATPEPVGDGFAAFKAKCDEVFGWVAGLGGYEDAVREAWKAARPAPGVPEGVVLVPLTDREMDAAIDKAKAETMYGTHHSGYWRDIGRGVLAAAQAKGDA